MVVGEGAHPADAEVIFRAGNSLEQKPSHNTGRANVKERLGRIPSGPGLSRDNMAICPPIYLIPVVEIPFTNCFWNTKNTMTIGRVSKITPAMTLFQ